jgi:hypothetical protein
MIYRADRDILATTLKYDIPENIVWVSQAIFPHEVVRPPPTVRNETYHDEAMAWCEEHCGLPAYIRQHGVKRVKILRSSAWAVYYSRYYFVNADQAFHFKMIYG